MHLYHATDKENLSSIMENGLLCEPPKHNWEGMTTVNWGNHLFLALDASAAESYVEAQDDAPDEIVVLKIDLHNLDEDLIGYDWNNRCEYHNEINSIIYSGNIKPTTLQICDADDEPFQDIDSFKDTPLYERIMRVFEEEVETNMENTDEDYTIPNGNGDIWVRPHFRKGRPVRGHYRKRR